MSLICKINEEDMFDISINSNKFTGILKLLNQHQKEQDQKLTNIEAKIEEMMNEIRSTAFKDDITSRVERLEAKVKILEDEIQIVRNTVDEKIENSKNEMIVQQKITNHNLFDDFQSNLNHLTENIQEIKKTTEEKLPKDINNLDERLNHLYSKVLNSQSGNEDLNQNTNFEGTPDKHDSDQIPPTENKTDEVDEAIEKIQNILISSTNKQPTEDENDINASDGISKSKLIELLTTTNYNKATLIQLAAELGKLSQKVDTLYTPIASQRTLDIPNRRNSTLDPTFEAQQTLAGINGIMSMVNNKIGKQQEDIKNLKNYIIKNESLERPIFYALIDALKLIHSHADGMEEIPVQKFETVSPEYFESDPDFQSKICRYCSRFPPKQAKADQGMPYIGDEEESNNDDIENKNNEIENNEGSEKVKPIKILNDKNSNNEEDELPSPPPPPSKNVKQISGLLHLVSCHTNHQESNHISLKNNNLIQTQIHSQIQAQVQAQLQDQLQTQVQAQVQAQLQAIAEAGYDDQIQDDSQDKNPKGIKIEQNKTIINNFKNNKIEILGTTGRPKPVLSKTINFVVVDMQIGDSIVPITESEVSSRMRDLCFMLGQFKREKDDLMSSIDRKVDRDFVERLFNKFRVLINEMNEKVIKIQSGSDKYATINQIEEIFKMIENVKTSIQTIVSSNSNNTNLHREEAAAGKRSCQECLFCGRKISLVAGGLTSKSLGDYEESSQFVYGEGGVFKKANTIGTKQNETKKINLPPLNGGSS